jgi:diacylglycerol kinase (ATP)
MAAWTAACGKSSDMDLATGIWGEMMFLKSAGLGIFFQLISIMEADKKKAHRSSSTRSDEIRRTLGSLKAMPPKYQSHAHQTTLDGEKQLERCFVAEVMNMGLIGLDVELAPEADPGDGMFDVALLGENDWGALVECLDKRPEGRPAVLKLTGRRANRARIASVGKLKIHIDDNSVSIDASAAMNARLKPGMSKFVISRELVKN